MIMSSWVSSLPAPESSNITSHRSLRHAAPAAQFERVIPPFFGSSVGSNDASGTNTMLR